jgi:hypothetical protein
LTASAPVAKSSGVESNLERKKAAVASGPKFREETPKKGSGKATPIASRTIKLRCDAQRRKGKNEPGAGATGTLTRAARIK